MRKLTCIFQCCLWPSSSNCPPRLQLDPPRRSAYPPHSLPLTAKSRGGRRSPSKACVFPHVATRPALKSKARKEEEKSLTFLGLNKSLEQGLNLSRS